MRYQHATDDRDQAIAAALSEFAEGNVVELRPRAAQPGRAARTPRRKASPGT